MITVPSPRRHLAGAALTVVLGLSAPQLPAVAHEPMGVTIRWDVPAWPGWVGGLELIVDGHEVLSEEGIAAATGMGEALTVTLSGEVGAPAPERIVGLCSGQRRGVVMKLSGVARGSHVAVSYSHASHGYRVEIDGVDLVVRLCERL